MSNITKIVSGKASLIWSIADKLVGVYKPHEYGDVILPLTVLKRFDSVLSDTKDKVLEMAKKYPETFAKRDFILKETAGQKFYNTSKYDFKKLLNDPDNIEENFYNYINGYSDEVKDIIKNFDLNKQIEKMAGNGILYQVIDTFNSEKANLHPSYVSNIEMGYIFEEIIRRFNELSNEEAGQHYTPREVIELMVNLIFEDEEDLADSSKIKTVYDGACGTGGMLTASMEYAKKLGIPWGVSEAAFNLRDLNNNYQYKAFGIPWLGLKRGLEDDMVVSPYSVFLSLNYVPKQGIENLRLLESEGMNSKYGFYESIDYTLSRLKYGKKYETVKTYMAHHQGLSLLSINNLINKNILVKRFMKNPEIEGIKILLQENRKIDKVAKNILHLPK